MVRIQNVRSNNWQRVSIVAFIMVVLLFVAGDVFAAANLHDPEGSVNGLLDLIKNSSGNWGDRLEGYAQAVFWSLASIQLVWTFFPLVFRQSDLGEIFGELIRFIMTIGFFYALLLFATEWASAIVQSFRQAGAAAAGLGTSELRPGDMFGLAIDLADMVGDTETLNPLAAMMIALAAVVVLLCFAFMAAFMGLTIVESYIVINASVIFMGLGASQWTREYAIAVMRYAVAVGAKLFIVTLLVGIVMDSADQWRTAYTYDDASMWTMVGLSLVCAYLTKTIPELIAGMINGTSLGGGGQVGSMAAAGVAGATAAIAAIATAGAAAPSSSGLAGTAANSSGSGHGGLADMLNASLGGGKTTDASTPIGTSASAAGNLASAAPRIGGGTSAQPSGGPAPSDNAPKPEKSKEGGTNQSEAKQDKKTGNASTPGQATHTLASGLVRSAGVLSAMSVPGMEGAAGLSLGTPPPSPLLTSEPEPSMEVQGVDNIIRPAEVSDFPPSSQASEIAAGPSTDGTASTPKMETNV
jgi:type IV secretion system protein TrbL